MKGIFSGLDKLGLGKLEKVEVFEDTSKKEEEKDGKKKAAAVTEADFLFEKTYVKFNRMQKAHQEKGEWMDSWKVEINPDHRTEGFSFRLVGCPIAKHAKAHGYEELLPYLCRTDHFLAEVMHARLIRTQTEALGGAYCDYWYVGDKSPVLEEYRGLKQI